MVSCMLLHNIASFCHLSTTVFLGPISPAADHHALCLVICVLHIAYESFLCSMLIHRTT
jgi:hypothetical protein